MIFLKICIFNTYISTYKYIYFYKYIEIYDIKNARILKLEK